MMEKKKTTKKEEKKKKEKKQKEIEKKNKMKENVETGKTKSMASRPVMRRGLVSPVAVVTRAKRVTKHQTKKARKKTKRARRVSERNLAEDLRKVAKFPARKVARPS